jgi:hypothetical protein
MRCFKFLLIFFLLSCKENVTVDFTTPYELSGNETTATYEEVIDFYRKLSDTYTQIELISIGKSDVGKPMNLVIFSNNGNFDPEYFHKNNLPVWLINNGIHPGESCGIDASMLFFRSLANEELETNGEFLIAAIPVYNIGGALNRNKTTRANQVGPEAYGFRGNAKNYDLNRDFIKMDTRNAAAFVEIFHYLNPDLFLDTHTSDGADFQHVMTLLATQPDKMGEPMAQYFRDVISPYLYQNMEKRGYPMTPYVQMMLKTPKQGISGFYDSPRYSTGYTTLFQTLGFMSEAHMLKPYEERVDATYQLMQVFLEILQSKGGKIKDKRMATLRNWQQQKSYPVQWELSKNKNSTIEFLGYEIDTIPGKATGFPRPHYNHQKPLPQSISFYEYYHPVKTINAPRAYIVPQAWQDVITRLKMNQVQMEQFSNDTILKVNCYHIDSFKTYSSPYEGHYPHYAVNLSENEHDRKFLRGDYWISTQQPAFRLILETLEPTATDAYFNWNFFDAVLSRKEYFSSYIFEAKAAEFLDGHPEINAAYEKRKLTDEDFANDPGEQLRFIYEQSPYFEKNYLQYPVYRVLK